MSTSTSPPTSHKENGDPDSYRQILKSSTLIGGASLINVVVGMVRGKAFALILGPAGFGLNGIYWSILNLAEGVAGMGVNTAGVRQIAHAVGLRDAERIALTAAVLRRCSLALGLLGATALVLAARPASRVTFGNDEHTFGIALLSLGVLFRTVSAGQGALIQGLRRIGDLARSGVLGSVFGAVAGVGLVLAFGEAGIVPSILAVEATSLLLTWWYSRRLQHRRGPLKPALVIAEAKPLLRLGFAFMASSILSMGSAYAIRTFLVRDQGLEAAGLYQSAWTIGGLYVGFILQAMGADFYPRLTTVVEDRPACNQLVNEQTQVGLLMAGAGTLATVTLAPVVVPLLYSNAFTGAVDLLRWICLGMLLRVATWPMGYIIVAGGRQRLFMFTETAYAVVHLAAAWVLVQFLGVTGAGVAFAVSYVFHGLLVYALVNRITGFSWSPENQRAGGVLLCLMGLTFGAFHVFPSWVATAVGLTSTLVSAAWSARNLSKLVPMDVIPLVGRLLQIARLRPRRAHDDPSSKKGGQHP